MQGPPIPSLFEEVNHGVSNLYCPLTSRLSHLCASTLSFFCTHWSVGFSEYICHSRGSHATWLTRAVSTIHRTTFILRLSACLSPSRPPWLRSYAVRQSKRVDQALRYSPMPASVPQHQPIDLFFRSIRAHHIATSPVLDLKTSTSSDKSSTPLRMMLQAGPRHRKLHDHAQAVHLYTAFTAYTR